MTTGEFAYLVKKMRDAQKEYFKTRSSDSLHHSKDLEKQVDEVLCSVGIDNRKNNRSRKMTERVFYITCYILLIFAYLLSDYFELRILGYMTYGWAVIMIYEFVRTFHKRKEK